MAVMVHEGLFVGNARDVYGFNGSVLHCAKDPWYVEAENALLSSVRGFRPFPNVIRINYNTMALNLVDADSPKYFSDEVVNAGLNFITERLAEEPVLCHCNQGLSRGPSMAFLWMHENGFLEKEFRYALPQFRELYPDFAPSNGVFGYLKNRIEKGEQHDSTLGK